MEEFLKLFNLGPQIAPQPPAAGTMPGVAGAVPEQPANVLNQPLMQQSAFQNMQSAAQGSGGGKSAFGSILKILGL